MAQRILIIGAGFAGMWSALAAARAMDLTGRTDGSVEIVLIAPEPMLHVRPKLYGSDISSVAAPLGELFDVVGVRYIQGTVETIRADDDEVDYIGTDHTRSTIAFDRLVLASGSSLFKPAIPGLADNCFNVDQLAGAEKLQTHLQTLAKLPDTLARNTVVVAGGGFTGIETAAEMPARLRAILGDKIDVNVIVVERADAIGPDLGPGPRPVIEQALRELGVTLRLGSAVTSVDADGMTISDGTRIATKTVIWTAGSRASELALQVPGKHDRFGRLHVTPDLRVMGADRIFAAGDVAFAATDDQGNYAMMSCQHAIGLGRSAGNNAAADLLGIPTQPYSQPKYVTCLALGPGDAVFTKGWNREVRKVAAEAAAIKHHIVNVLIYPPRAIRAEALAAADPAPR